jgi:DnaJ-class molecular chaperone
MAETTLYDILELSPTAASDEIKAAYRQLSTQVHPDRGGSNALFRLVREAYETLSDDNRRAEYDRSGINSAGPTPRARSADGGSGREEDIKMLADRTLALNKSLLRLKAEATTDHDHLEVCRVQLKLHMAQIAWNMAVFRQLSAQGKMEAAARFHAKANEGEKSLPPIEKLIASTEVLIAEKARASQATGSPSVRMISCTLCGVRNRVSPGTRSFSCGSCQNKHLMFSCDSCTTQTYVGTDLNGTSAMFVCETCNQEKVERRKGNRRKVERRRA